MKNKQKTIGISPLDYYLSYNTSKEKNNSENAEQIEEKLEHGQSAELNIATVDVTTTQPDSIGVSDSANIQIPLNNKEHVPDVDNLRQEESKTEELHDDTRRIAGRVTAMDHLHTHIDETVPTQEELSFKIKKERVTIHVPASLIDKVKNAVYWEPGLTLAGFAEIALERFLTELEEERGEPFPARRRHRLSGGRPLK